LRLRARGGAGVQLGHDLGQLHAPAGKRLAVEEHHRHGHDLPRFHLGLEQRAVDRVVAHARVQHRHQVQRLHHVGAVVAGQAHPGFEHQLVLRLQRLHLLDEGSLHLGRVAAGLQQRQHQRGELVAQRQRREVQAHVGAGPRHLERRPPRRRAVEPRAHHRRVQRGHLGQQLAHLERGGAVVKRSDQLNGLLQALQIPGQLPLNATVQHKR
jgi:hypothetical protein